MTEITDTSERSALDRRSAIKKVAVGGAIAWTAPAVLSSRVSAQEVTCTPKCRPVGGVVITADVRIAECGPRPPAPGNQPVNGQLVSVTAAGDSCGCGGTPTVVVVSPAIGDTFEIRPNPGNESAFFTVAVQLTCLDRQDRPVTVNCDIDFEEWRPRELPSTRRRPRDVLRRCGLRPSRLHGRRIGRSLGDSEADRRPRPRGPNGHDDHIDIGSSAMGQNELLGLAAVGGAALA